jgi:hypothetical protein
MIIVFIVASALFWISVFMDASSSSGMMEKTKILRNKAGRFSLGKYLLIMIGLYAVMLVAVLVGHELVYIIVGSGILVVGAVMRFRVAAKNRALKKKSRNDGGGNR